MFRRSGLLLLLGGILFFVITRGDIVRGSFKTLLEVKAWILLVTIFGVFLSYYLRSQALRVFCKPTSLALSNTEAWRILISGFGISVLIPGSFGLGSAPLLAKYAETKSVSKRYALVLGGCFVLAELVGYAVNLSLITPLPGLLAAGMVIAASIAGILSLCLIAPRRLELGLGDLARHSGPLRPIIQRIADGFSQLPDQVTTLSAGIQAMLIACLSQVVLTGTFLLLAYAIAPSVELKELLTGGVFTTLSATVISPTPQGIGIAEGLGGLAFSQNMSSSSATAIIIIWRTISLWLILLVSGLTLLNVRQYAATIGQLPFFAYIRRLRQ